MEKKPGPNYRQIILNILILLAVAAISVLVYEGRHWIRSLGALGYPGMFLVGLFSSAAMFVPVPGLMVLAVSPVAFDPFWAGMLFAIGAAIGEMSGYMAGTVGNKVIQRSKWYDKTEYYMKKYGGIAIMVLGFIPNPLIDVAGMVAGALKMPWYKFLFWVFLGKVPKCLLIAYGGAAVLQFFK